MPAFAIGDPAITAWAGIAGISCSSRPRHTWARTIPYYCLWRLLEPEVLSTKEAFDAYPPDSRRRHFIRRTKEEMVTFDGSRIYPNRVSDTLSYDLAQGEIGEQSFTTGPPTTSATTTTAPAS